MGHAVRLGPQRHLAGTGERVVLGREQRLAVIGDAEVIALGLQRERVPDSGATLTSTPANCSRFPLTTR
jgi:hypothetical protein